MKSLQSLLLRVETLRALLLRVEASRTLARRSAIFGAVLVAMFSASVASGQTAAAPAAAPAAATTADFAGRWEGTVEIPVQGGDPQQQPALLILKEDGLTLAGTAGDTDDHLMAVREVKLSGSEILFLIGQEDGSDMQVHLRLADGHLVGDATKSTPDGPFTVKVDLVRVKR
jgi:hypothetical protein